MSGQLPAMLALTDSLEYEEDGWVRLDHAQIDADSVVFVLTLNSGRAPDEIERWQVTARRVVAYHVQSEENGVQYVVELTEDSPLLQEFTDRYYTLGFLGTPRNAHALCLALLSLTRESTTRRNDIKLHTTPDFYRAGHGFAGRGPEFLMRACLAAMEAEGMEPYLTLDNYNTYAERVAKAGQARLFSVGRSYIVAGDFDAERLPPLPTEDATE